MTDSDIRPSLSASSAAAVADRVAIARARTPPKARRADARSVGGCRQAGARPDLTYRARRVRAHGRVRTDHRDRTCALCCSICRRCEGLIWRYSRRNLRHRAAVDARLPDRRYLPGAGLPRLREAIHAARFGLVGRVSDRDRRIVLCQSRRHVLARLARHATISVGLAALIAVAPACVPARAQMDTRRPAQPPHGHCRRRRCRRGRDRGIAAAEGHRRRHHRPVRRSRR